MNLASRKQAKKTVLLGNTELFINDVEIFMPSNNLRSSLVWRSFTKIFLLRPYFTMKRDPTSHNSTSQMGPQNSQYKHVVQRHVWEWEIVHQKNIELEIPFELSKENFKSYDFFCILF